MEILRNVHIVKSDQGVKVLFLNLNVSKLPDFHHELHFLLVSQSLVYQDVFNILLFIVDFEILVLILCLVIPRVLLPLVFNIIMFSFLNLLLVILPLKVGSTLRRSIFAAHLNGLNSGGLYTFGRCKLRVV